MTTITLKIDGTKKEFFAALEEAVIIMMRAKNEAEDKETHDAYLKMARQLDGIEVLEGAVINPEKVDIINRMMMEITALREDLHLADRAARNARQALDNKLTVQKVYLNDLIRDWSKQIYAEAE